MVLNITMVFSKDNIYLYLNYGVYICRPNKAMQSAGEVDYASEKQIEWYQKIYFAHRCLFNMHMLISFLPGQKPLIAKMESSIFLKVRRREFIKRGIFRTHRATQILLVIQIHPILVLLRIFLVHY